MTLPENPTIAERLYWAYANLGMAEKAVHDGETRYGGVHFMIRNRLYTGYLSGKMSPRSMTRDQRIKMKLPQQCIYCGSRSNLSLDHIVPTHRGGTDGGDNVVWACRSCNSSKCDTDLFDWWSRTRGGFPPLFAIRVYLKQAILYFSQQGQMTCRPGDVAQSPFGFENLPTEFPDPTILIFTPHHAEKAQGQTGEDQGEPQPDI